MKKYKLIKTYPGSPELGTIASRGMGIKFEYSNGAVVGFSSSKGKDFESLIENQPEFWEEIVEKDYQILSFKQDGLCEDLWTEFSYGWCRNSNGNPVTDPYSYDDILNNHLNGGIKYHINSVKRLSDGEVFTVGDRIQYYNITGEKSHTHVISDITIYENKILLNHNHGTWKSHGDFNKVQKVKQPLFTTEDGVDIYEGNRLYIILPDFSIGLTGNLKSKPKALCFASKERTEEYVLMNKPCLSVNDFLLNKDTSFNALVGMTLSKLRELAKSKL